MEEFIKLLREELNGFGSDHGMHEPDTGAFVFDNESSMAYAEGLERALEIAENLQSTEPN